MTEVIVNPKRFTVWATASDTGQRWRVYERPVAPMSLSKAEELAGYLNERKPEDARYEAAPMVG